MQLNDFDYFLPPTQIAQHPPAARDGGRLMLLSCSTGQCLHHQLAELPDLLPKDGLLVVNDSRVIPARIWARRVTSGRVELLLIEPAAFNGEGAGTPESTPAGSPAAAAPLPDPASWICLARSAKALHEGEHLVVEAQEDGVPPPTVTISQVLGHGRYVIEVPSLSALLAHGSMPLPPYIRRETTRADRQRYQTIYAQQAGSIAAPTAGLHFTPQLLDSLDQKGIERCAITLHVGPGTFLPVRSEQIEDHQMESERFWIPSATARAIERARIQGRPVIAVGTTVVRALESSVGRAGRGRAELFIKPGYKFKVVSSLMTNFHLPKSTLLMLVAALAGREQILAAYGEAVRAGYRFYSYGDAMLIV